ncbi:MAG: hypothetical protein ACJAT4_001468 [Granulosicoccus sp.]|jgi:hypothetical protein
MLVYLFLSKLNMSLFNLKNMKLYSYIGWCKLKVDKVKKGEI